MNCWGGMVLIGELGTLRDRCDLGGGGNEIGDWKMGA